MVRIGSATYTASGATLDAVLASLTSQIDAHASYAASKVSTTGVAQDWNAIIAVLKARVEAGEAVTAAVTSSGLKLTAEAFNVPFTARAVADADDAMVHNGATLVVAPSASTAQTSVIEFLGAPVNFTSYTVVIDGKVFTVDAPGGAINDWTNGSTTNPGILNALSRAILADAALAARFSIAVGDNGANGRMTFTAKAVDTAFSIDFVGSSSLADWTAATVTEAQAPASNKPQISRVVFASQAQPPVVGHTYGVTIDNQSFTVKAGSDGVDATWNSVRSALAAKINAASGGSALASAANESGQDRLRITGRDDNVAFTVTAETRTGGADVTNTGSAPTTPAGHSHPQVSDIVFDTSAPVEGRKYTVQVAGREYSVTVQSGESFDSLMGRLVLAINGDAANTTVTASNRNESVTYFTDASRTTTATRVERSLRLTGRADNVAFTVSGASVTYQSTTTAQNPGVVVNQASAGSSATQVQTLTFPADATPGATVNYTVTVGGHSFSVKVGDVVGGSPVTPDWTSLLGALASRINGTAAAPASALADGAARTLTLTGKAANTAFSVTATGRDENPNLVLALEEDSVLIVPDRTAGSFSVTTEGNLTVVNLPTFAGESISLQADDNLVVVTALNLGRSTPDNPSGGGELRLSAGAAITLGGRVTAETLTVSAGDDLTITSSIGNLYVTMDGDGNLTVFQTGDLTIGSIVMDGGDITIVASGSVDITSITGNTGNVLIQSGGHIHITNLAEADHVTLQAALDVSVTLEADTLDIVANGAVTVAEADGVTLERIVSGGGAVSVTVAATSTSDGNLVVGGAILATLGSGVTLGAGGTITLERAITTDSGAIAVTAGRGLTMGEEADVATDSGNVSLDAGTGALAMHSDTYVEAGGGAITLRAGGDITLGKLRSDKAGGTLAIDAGGWIRSGAGDTDIVAATSTLVIHAGQGVGEAADALETQVAVLDVSNSGGGAIALLEADDVSVKRLAQGGTGSVELATVRGSITVAARPVGAAAADWGIRSTSGDIALYAAGAAAGGAGGTASLTIGNSLTTTGGSIRLTAEDGPLTLAAQVQAGGSGSITLAVPKGGVQADPLATGWKGTAGVVDPNVDWAMRNGYFTMDQASGEIVAAGIPGYLEAGRLANGTVLRAAGGPFLQAAGGHIGILARDAVGAQSAGFLYSPLAIVVDALTLRVSSSERAEVALLATGAIAVEGGSASGSRGGTTQVGSLSGMQTITSAVDASGEDITIRGSDIDIVNAPIRSVGATLNVAPLNPATTVVIGNLAGGATSQPGWMVLDNDDLSNLEDGFRAIVIGAANTAGHIMVGGAGSTDTVTLKDTLHLVAPMLGSHVSINTRLVLQGNSSFLLVGSGHTTALAGSITAGASLDALDSLSVTGEQTLTAGADAGGHMRLGGSGMFIDGDGAAGDDVLHLRATGNITIASDVGATDALEGLTIGGVGSQPGRRRPVRRRSHDGRRPASSTPAAW